MNKWISAVFSIIFMFAAIATTDRTHSLILGVSAAVMTGISRTLAELEEIKNKQK